MNFSNQTLSHVRFQGALLKGIPFNHSNLTHADFTGALIDGCDFREATLEGVEFSLSSAVGADFSGLHLKSCVFRAAQLRDSSFEGSTIEDCIFDEADMENVRFKGATFTRTSFLQSVFSGTDFSETRFESETIVESKGDNSPSPLQFQPRPPAVLQNDNPFAGHPISEANGSEDFPQTIVIAHTGMQIQPNHSPEESRGAEEPEDPAPEQSDSDTVRMSEQESEAVLRQANAEPSAEDYLTDYFEALVTKNSAMLLESIKKGQYPDTFVVEMREGRNAFCKRFGFDHETGKAKWTDAFHNRLNQLKAAHPSAA
jgi:Pentapeptide repeats (9 copies)